MVPRNDYGRPEAAAASLAREASRDARRGYFFFAFFAPFFAGFFAAFFVAFFFTAICYLLETWSRRRTSKTNAD
jgi:hypothetical protein